MKNRKTSSVCMNELMINVLNRSRTLALITYSWMKINFHIHTKMNYVLHFLRCITILVEIEIKTATGNRYIVLHKSIYCSHILHYISVFIRIMHIIFNIWDSHLYQLTYPFIFSDRAVADFTSVVRKSQMWNGIHPENT